MTGHPDTASSSILLPSRMVFYLGNYSNGSLSVRWNGDALIVEETAGGNFNSRPRVILPGPERWESFWKEIDDTGVWSWDENFVNPHGCCGVTYWQLVLEAGARKISSSGEDRFPGGLSREMTQEFRTLVNAIKKLCENVPDTKDH